MAWQEEERAAVQELEQARAQEPALGPEQVQELRALFEMR